MTRTKLLSLMLMAASFTGAQAAETIPKGWVVAGSKPANYEFGVDPSVTYDSTRSAYIKFRALVQDEGGFGTLTQTIGADAYRGMRVRLSAMLKTKAANAAEMWMRVDGPNGVLGFDNMGNRAVQGTNDWARYDIVLDVPQNTNDITFGFYLEGTGMVWADGFRLEPVGKDVAVTGSAPHPLPNAPVNLNFEDPRQ